MKKILRFYLSNTDTIRHESLYEEIARAAQREQLAGATVLQGIMGYGKASKLRSNKFWELNVKYPIVVEILMTRRSYRLSSTRSFPPSKCNPRASSSPCNPSTSCCASNNSPYLSVSRLISVTLQKLSTIYII